MRFAKQNQHALVPAHEMDERSGKARRRIRRRRWKRAARFWEGLPNDQVRFCNDSLEG
jgi:hypothetical protein